MEDPQQPFGKRLGSEALNRTPLYLIFGLLFYAPFCFGLREGAGETGFVTLAFFAFFVFCWDRFLNEQWPRVPVWLIFCFAIIALQGLWMQLNANSHYVWHDVVKTVRIMDPAPFPNLPGSRHRIETPIQFYPQLGVFCLMIILVNLTSAKRRQVLIAGTLAAVAFATIGLMMKLDLRFGQGTMIRWYWDLDEPRFYSTVFAGYRYHGNAATFLTIGLCLNLGLVLETLQTRNLRMRTLASIGTGIMLFSLIINTSRAGWVLAVIVVLLFGKRMLWNLWQQRDQGGLVSRGIVVALVVAVALGILAYSSLNSDDGYRQAKLSNISESLSKRFPAVLFWEMWKETPVLGFGPGAFAAVFPKYQLLHPGHLSMEWYLNEAHQDYVQILLDWGVPAFVCWILIFLCPLFSRASRDADDPHVLTCRIVAFAVLLHAMADFPLQVTSLLLYFGLALAYLTARQAPEVACGGTEASQSSATSATAQ